MKIKTLHSVSFLVLALVSLSPQLKYFSLYNYVLYLTALLHYSFSQHGRLSKHLVHTLAIFLFLSTLLILFGRANTVPWFSIILFPALFYAKSTYTNNRRQFGANLQILITLCIIFNTFTLYGISLDSYTARAAKTIGEVATENQISYVGGYDYVYSVGLFGLFLIMFNDELKKEETSVFWFVLRWCCVSTSIAVVMYSGFLYALLALALSLGLYAVYRTRTSRSQYRIFVAVILIAIIAAVQSKITWSEEVSAKVKDIELYAEIGLSEVPFIRARSEAYLQSVEAFQESPVWGKFADSKLATFSDVAGRHSFLLDTAALFGTLGVGLVAYIFGVPFWITYLQFRPMQRAKISIGCIYVLAVGVFNIITPTLLLITYGVLLSASDQSSLITRKAIN